MRNLLFAAGAALVLGTTSAQAGLLDFDFWFSNLTGTVAGTVTGEIEGLTDNQTTSAAHVFIDSYPAGLGLGLAAPFDTIGTAIANSFTVSGGHIVDATYFSPNAPFFVLGLNFGGDALELGTGSTINGSGLAAITFTSVPELSTWAMALLGFAGLGFASHRRATRRGRMLGAA